MSSLHKSYADLNLYCSSFSIYATEMNTKIGFKIYILEIWLKALKCFISR